MVMGDYGVHTRRELAELGYDRALLRRAITAGDLTPLRRDWYADRMCDEDVATAVHSGGVLGCVSALRLHGLWIPPGYTDLHIRRSKALRNSGTPGCRPFHGRPLPTSSAVDPAVYALACAARCMKAEDWIATCDSYLKLRRIDVEELRSDIAPFGGAGVDALLDKTDGRSQSETESIARVRFRALGFKVVVQPAVDYRIYEGHADLRIGKLLLECDSARFHNQAKDRGNDYTHDRKALVGGWQSMRFAFHHVLHEWDEIVEDVRAYARDDRHRIRSRRAKEALARSRQIDGIGDY